MNDCTYERWRHDWKLLHIIVYDAVDSYLYFILFQRYLFTNNLLVILFEYARRACADKFGFHFFFLIALHAFCLFIVFQVIQSAENIRIFITASWDNEVIVIDDMLWLCYMLLNAYHSIHRSFSGSRSIHEKYHENFQFKFNEFRLGCLLESNRCHPQATSA